MTRLAIMQPYFLPYTGYFQLICATDTFVVYDNIQYTKKGWINRNRFLRNGSDEVFSVPLKSAPDGLDVRERFVSAEFKKIKLLNQFREAYRKAPYFHPTMDLLEDIVLFEEANLFQYVRNSLDKVCHFLDIKKNFVVSSTIQIDHSLKAQHKVLSICDELQATSYVNPIGGTSLYSKSDFAERGVELLFLKPAPFVYTQLGTNFVPSLSIVDAMMFNAPIEIKAHLTSGYELT